MGLFDDDGGGIEIASFELKGWKAVAAIAAIIAVVICVRITVHHNRPLEGAAAAIQPWIMAEYTRAQLESVKDKMDSNTMQAEDYERLTSLGKIEITDIKIRGSVARVEYTVGGKPPSDGRSPRYYRMDYTPMIGWTMESQTSKLFYNLSFF